MTAGPGFRSVLVAAAATIMGVLLIPMLYVAVEKVIGGAKQAPVPTAAPGGTVAAEHGSGAH